MDYISTSQALQIGGRAGRYNTAYEQGEVTTFYTKDLATLTDILSQPVEPVTQGGLHPTADQIELFAYHLPKSSLSNLIVSHCNAFLLDLRVFRQSPELRNLDLARASWHTYSLL